MEKKYEDVTREELIRLLRSLQREFIIHVALVKGDTDEG